MYRKSLKNAVGSVKMPEDMKRRIIENCEKQVLYEGRALYVKGSDEIRADLQDTDHSTKKGRNINMKKRYVAILAAVMLCICLPVAGMAMGNTGFFKDIKAPGGAITGMVYEQAAQEINVSAELAGDQLIVSAEFLKPDAAPYGFIDQLAIGEYSIVDASGNVVAGGNGNAAGGSGSAGGMDAAGDEGAEAQGVAVDGTVMEIGLSVPELDAGDYILKIGSFIGSAKADQPLPINGPWECEFSV